jgi:hypothetical protein
MHVLSTIRLLCILVTALICCISPVPGAAAQAAPHFVEIADVAGGRELAALLSGKGITAVIVAGNMWVVDQQSNCAVWIGKQVPLELLRVVLPEALRLNPHLKFFHVVGDRGEVPPARVDQTVHIGGSIEAALLKQLNIVDQKELLDTLERVKTLDQLHRYLHEKNIPRASPGT